MKLGLFDHMQKNDRAERTYADLYASHLEIVASADAAGLDFYFVAEHHFDLGFSECPSPGVFLGAASQRTERVRLGPLVYVLPLWNPIRIAEEIAMLDNLTRGRLECGFGSGVGPFTFSAYGVSWNQKREMTLEALRMIQGIWANKSYSYEGKYFRCHNAELGIPLVQKPHPPIWMPTRSRESIAEAAAAGISTVQWVPPKMKAVREAFDYYRRVYQQARPAGRKPHIGLMRQIYVAASDDKARAGAKGHWEYFWHRRGGGRAYGAGAHENLTSLLDGPRKQELLDMDRSIAEGAFICGAPETAARQIRDIATQAGADTFLGEFTFGALEHAEVMSSLRLFVDEVAPGLKEFAIDALHYPAAQS